MHQFPKFRVCVILFFVLGSAVVIGRDPGVVELSGRSGVGVKLDAERGLSRIDLGDEGFAHGGLLVRNIDRRMGLGPAASAPRPH